MDRALHFQLIFIGLKVWKLCHVLRVDLIKMNLLCFFYFSLSVRYQHKFTYLYNIIALCYLAKILLSQRKKMLKHYEKIQK